MMMEIIKYCKLAKIYKNSNKREREKKINTSTVYCNQLEKVYPQFSQED